MLVSMFCIFKEIKLQKKKKLKNNPTSLPTVSQHSSFKIPQTMYLK